MAQSKTNDVHNFGQKLVELEQLTAWFESDQLDLDAGLAKFERGMVLVAELRAGLAQAENKIEKIKAQFGQEVGGEWGEPEIGVVAQPDNAPGVGLGLL